MQKSCQILVRMFALIWGGAGWGWWVAAYVVRCRASEGCREIVFLATSSLGLAWGVCRGAHEGAASGRRLCQRRWQASVAQPRAVATAARSSARCDSRVLRGGGGVGAPDAESTVRLLIAAHRYAEKSRGGARPRQKVSRPGTRATMRRSGLSCSTDMKASFSPWVKVSKGPTWASPSPGPSSMGAM